MKVNLRKANALQHAINEEMVALRKAITPEVVFDDYDQDPAETMSNAFVAVNSMTVTLDQLLDAYYNIREQVGIANVESGIASKLAQVAKVEKRMQIMSRFAEAAPRKEVSSIKQQLVRQQEQDSRYGYGSKVTSTFMEAQQIAESKDSLQKLKRDKQQLQDELLELNMTTKITLDDITVSVLETAGIL